MEAEPIEQVEWKGSETASAARAVVRKHRPVEINLPANYHHALFARLRPGNAPAQPETYTPAAEQTPPPAFEAKEVAQTPSYTSEATTESGFSQPAETASEPVQSAPRARLSDRNVDLPIEVTEEERRLHNDARRFARLLVSEIKLYNEQKVREGREANDLYERLREAIDRSREMYDKRVQPSVAARFDYFHYELVSSLGEGDVSKLGDSYPGSTV